MDEIRNALSYLYNNCEIDEQHSDEVEHALDTLDWIMNIIESTNSFNQADCADSIIKIKNITHAEEVEESFEDSF